MKIPTWEECAQRIVSDEPLSPLQEFIHEQEPLFGGGNVIWRQQLQAAVDFLMDDGCKK